LKGFNKIDFEALNQRSSGPNTAEFQIYDDNGGLISASQWNLGTGFKATIVVTKNNEKSLKWISGNSEFHISFNRNILSYTFL
jgi:hypothetical protein